MASDTKLPRVNATLKAVVETELARMTVAGTKLPGGVSAFFSRGIIFSKTGSDELRPDESQILQTITALDEISFHAFADRLMKLRETKGIGQAARPLVKLPETKRED
jgi:translation initiation factor 6 (eIF-6)